MTAVLTGSPMATNDILSPIDGSSIAQVNDMGEDAVDRAFEVAKQAAPGWAATTARRRATILLEVARLIDLNAEEIAAIETRNTGKLSSEAQRDVLRAAECFRYYAGWADKAFGTVLDGPEDFHTYTRREPFGVVVGIIPWNSPFVFAAKKIAPALAFGNVSILKPARETPLSAIRLAELLAEAGAPAGVVQVITGGPEAGKALVRDARADLIVFTGSDGSGRHIAQAAGANLTPVVMELGGKSPQLVFADADLDAAVAGIIRGIFSNAGQMCIAGSRVYVQESVYPRFLGLLRERISLLRVGDPRKPETDIGPQATTVQQAKTRRMVSTAVAEGAEVVAQLPVPAEGTLGGGYFVEPTVLAGVTREAEIMRDEVFGPVMCIDTFADERDAVDRAHETTYGLAAGIWTVDVAKAHRVANSLRVGTVWINCYRVLADAIPFGGVGSSGFGREGGPEAVSLYTRVKSIWINLAG